MWLLLDASSSADIGVSIGGKLHPFFWPLVALVVIVFLVRWLRRRSKD